MGNRAENLATTIFREITQTKDEWKSHLIPATEPKETALWQVSANRTLQNNSG